MEVPESGSFPKSHVTAEGHLEQVGEFTTPSEDILAPRPMFPSEKTGMKLPLQSLNWANSETHVYTSASIRKELNMIEAQTHHRMTKGHCGGIRIRKSLQDVQHANFKKADREINRTT